MMPYVKWGPYRFGSDQLLTNRDVEVLARAIERSGCPTGEGGLAGRGQMARVMLNGSKKVVVKPYCRGGIVRHVIKRHYLWWGKRRCQGEYEMLRHVKALGVNVPEPVAYAFQGCLFYRAWLITKEIDRPERLSDLSLRDEQCGLDLTATVTRLTAQLIDHEIQHVDLHPGNVLIDGSGKVFLVDFDKACFYRKGRHRLSEAYINRWSRAVGKHDLPHRLKKAFSLGLTEALNRLYENGSGTYER